MQSTLNSNYTDTDFNAPERLYHNMKKLILITAAALALAACDKNDDNPSSSPVAAQISATIGKSVVSRATDTDWAKGDRIGISMTGRNVSYLNIEYVTDDGDGNFSGTSMFFNNHIDPITITAYYPFSGSGGTAPATLTASTTDVLQTAVEQPKFDFLYARKENVTGSNPIVNLAFSHMMSKITLIFVKGNDGTDVSKITSYTISGLVLDGSFDPVTGVCATTDGAQAEPISMVLPEGTVKDGVALSPLIVFPQKPATDQVKLKIKDSDNQDYACSLNFGTDGLVAGNNYQFTVKVSKTGLSVKYSITDWQTIEDKNHEAGSAD